MKSLILTIVFLSVTAASAAVGAETVTYEFTAKITKNGGIYYFAPGTKVKGSFTYDLEAKRVPVPNGDPRCFRYVSDANKFEFVYNGKRFAAAEKVVVSVSVFESHESVTFITGDLGTPDGWGVDRRDKSGAFGVSFGNSPPQLVLRAPKLPKTIVLSDFKEHEMRLGFGFGAKVRFPGGEGKVAGYVTAEIITLKPMITK